MNSRLLPFMTGESGESVSFDVAVARINPQAVGVFGGLTDTFTIGGQTYTVTHFFTDSNGIQFRFSTQAQRDAFIAADFTINVAGPGLMVFGSTFPSVTFMSSSLSTWSSSVPTGARFQWGYDSLSPDSTYTITISTV